MKQMSRAMTALTCSAVIALSACSDTDVDVSDDGALSVPDTYEFRSQFRAESSVNYRGQICRHTLITALTNAVRDENEIGKDAYQGDAVPYFDDTIAGTIAEQSTQTTLGTDLPVPESEDTLGKLCGTKHLVQKLAGNDTVTDYKDWNSGFQGVAGENSAEAYARRLIREVSEQVAGGNTVDGEPHYVSATGIDYAQMIQKFLLGAVVFAQAADDYLDNDVAGKGLLAAATQSGDNPYSTLEHQWDEGFGYFGAARAYLDRTDEVNRSGVVDDNNDGFIDVLSEHNFGASTNAAKRDVGADPSAPVDLSGEGFTAFATGRAIITAAGVSFNNMTPAQQAQLLTARDAAVSAWERAYAATIVHYINDVLDDMTARANDSTVGLADLAKHFSEMKGFALGLQFNPASPILRADENNADQNKFQRLHELLGDAPALTNDQDYRADLLEARALLGDTYGFAQANLEVW